MAENGMTNGNRGPWWIQVIQTIGPTAAIAIFLVYVLAAQVTPALDAIKTFMALHVRQMQEMTEDIHTEQNVQSKQWETLKGLSMQEHMDRERALAVQEQTCVNSAKSSFQTQKCMDARNAGEAAAQ